MLNPNLTKPDLERQFGKGVKVIDISKLEEKKQNSHDMDSNCPSRCVFCNYETTRNMCTRLNGTVMELNENLRKLSDLFYKTELRSYIGLQLSNYINEFNKTKFQLEGLNKNLYDVSLFLEGWMLHVKEQYDKRQQLETDNKEVVEIV